MRVEVRNGEVVCVTEDFKKLKSNERKFLSDCYFQVCWTGLTEDGYLRMYKRSSARGKVSTINSIKYCAANNRIEVTEEVTEYLRELESKAREESRREEEVREAERKREQWQNRRERGCAGCEYSIQVGDGWFRCRYSGDELESRFSEKYNPIMKAMEIFHEIGVPNERCKDYVRERVVAFGGTK